MHAQRWLVQLFTWLLLCPNDPGNTICGNGSTWYTSACATCSLAADEEKHLVLTEMWGYSQVFYTSWAMLSLHNRSLCRATSLSPLNGAAHELWSLWLIRELWAGHQESPSLIPSHGEKLALGITQLCLFLQTHVVGCTPAASACGHGGYIMFIFTSCLGLALNSSSWAKGSWGSSPWVQWLNEAPNMFWFGERKGMSLYQHIFLSSWLLCACIARYKLHKDLASAVPTARQHSLKEMTIFIVELSSILLDEWSSSLP